jgi:hypothetical protein
MDWMTITEIAIAILLAEAVLAAVRWVRSQQGPAAAQPAAGPPGRW